MKHNLLLSILALSMVGGCAFDQQARRDVDAHHTAAKADIETAIRKTEQRMDDRAQLISKVRGKWIGGKSIALSSEEALPAVFYEKWAFVFPGRVNVATAAERITTVTGVPVMVKADAYMPLDRLLPTAGGAAGGTETSSAAAVPVNPADVGQFGSVNSTALNFSTDMELNFTGTLYDFLNRVSSRAAVNWEYSNGRIEFFRLQSKTFTLKTTPGDAAFSGSVGKTGTTSGGVSGEGASSTASQASFASDSNVKMSSNYSVWDSVESAVEAMLSPIGRVSVNQGTGSITVTDLKENVDTIGEFIEGENSMLNRQIRLKVEVLNVQLGREFQSGVDWNLVYSKLNDMLSADWAVTLASPTSLVGAQAAGLGLKITASGERSGLDSLNGSTALLRILNGFGKAAITNTTNAATTNRQPVPVAITNQVTYVASTSPAAAVTGGTGGLPGLTPATVTTGFILNMLPTVQENGSVLLNLSLDISELKRLNTVTSGSGDTQQSIQTPEVSSMQFLQRASLRSGETLVLAGFERETNQYDKRTLTENGDSALSGSIVGAGRKEAFVILVTPVIEDN